MKAIARADVDGFPDFFEPAASYCTASRTPNGDSAREVVMREGARDE